MSRRSRRICASVFCAEVIGLRNLRAMVDNYKYYRFGQYGDFAIASALGVVADLLASDAALVYIRRLTR